MKRFHIISAAILTTRCALTTVLVVLMMLTVQTAFAAENGWDIQASTSGNVTTFTISRTNTAVAETVKYRLVNLSAYAGQHYYVSQVNGENKTTVAAQTAALSGEFTFAAGETESRTIQVTESAANTNAYKYQTGTKRSYKLEMTDAGGFYLTSNTRSFTTGTSIKSSNVYAEKSVTVNSDEIKVTDDNYSQAYHAVSVSNYYTAAAPKAYLEAAGAELRMTLSFQAKESDDGYQHVQILVNQTSNHDEGSGDNNPGTMSYSSYMATFCHEGGSKNTTYSNYLFPDVTHGSNCGNVGKVWSSINSTNDVGELRQQYFNTNCRASDGRLIIASKSALSSFSTLGIRFDASGNNEDTWYAKGTAANIQAVDVTAPTMQAISVAPGRHSKGNTVYVSVAFSEIVTTSSAKLTSNWGDLSYVAGSGTNVLTFSRTIPASASSALNITGFSGIADLAGKAPSSVTATNLCSVDESYTYTISYNLNEGTVATENPTTYTWETATFTLNNPTKTGYVFNGWTGSNGSTASTSVTIANHSHGNKSYTANWTNVWGVSADVDGSTAEKAYTISTTQGLDLLAQCVNSGNHFSNTYFQLGDDITYSHTTDWNDASSEENNFTAIGTLNKPFYGTFDGNNYTVSGIRIYNPDGNCQGLFGCIMNSSTVRRVRLADSRITAKNNVGGIVGYNGTSCTVEDCAVAADVCIHAKVTDADYHGGITGYNAFYSKVQRCISRATLTVADATDCDYYGGIAGYLCIASDNTCSTIRYCLVIGATIPDVGKRGAIAGKMPTKQGYTQYNYYRSCTVAGVVNATGVGSGEHGNDGISTDVGQNYGAQPLYAVTLPANASLVRTPATDAPLPGTNNTIYFTGADIEGVPYAFATAKLNLSYDIAALTTGYTVAVSAAETTGGTAVAVTDNGNYTYDLTMPKADVTVTATPTNVWGVSADIDGTTAEKAYTITTTDGLDLLATLVNNGDGFIGKFFKLGNDITYDHTTAWNDASSEENNYTAIGGYYNGGWKNFRGTFDGQGHTVSGIRIYKGGDDRDADAYQGLFGRTWDAIIKNVNLSDARITGYVYVGGIAGILSGTMENCRVVSDVTIHAVVNGTNRHGGVVGYFNIGTIRGCVSTATLTVASGLTGNYDYGGIAGSLGNNSNMSDCLALGATVPAVDDHYDAIAGYVYTNMTLANNYHRDCTVGGNAAPSDTYNVSAYTISAGTDVTVAPAGTAAQTYDYNGIQRYGNALYYGGVLYAPADADVSLTLGYGSVPTGLTVEYTPTAGTLSGTENPYTLTMPAEDVTIDGRLKKVITITTKNMGRIYDGYPLTTSADPVTALNGDGWNITSPTSPVLEDGDQITLTFPSLTEVGSIENRPTVVIRNSNNEDVTANYNITFTCGTLTVRYYQVTLFDNSQDGENIRAIERALGLPKVNVQLQSRILYKDGDWNTLCVPFSLSAEQIAESPLAGADIRTLSDASLAGGVLTLNFTPAAPAEGAVTSMEAGVPYLIKWTKPDPYIPYNYTNEDDCSDIYKPIFQGVTLSQDMYPVRCDFTNLGSDYYMEFMGTYNTIFWHGERDILFLGANNTLYYPNDDNRSQIGAFRAYFQFSWRLTNADVRAFNLNFGEEAQGIGSLNSLTPDPSLGGEGSIYSLDGRKLDGKPTKKGLYIVNGNKVVIK